MQITKGPLMVTVCENVTVLGLSRPAGLESRHVPRTEEPQHRTLRSRLGDFKLNLGAEPAFPCGGYRLQHNKTLYELGKGLYAPCKRLWGQKCAATRSGAGWGLGRD